MTAASSISKLLVLPLIALTVGFATTSQARENHCDHSKGKARGTIIGGVLGAGLGALVGKGKTEGVVIGGLGGAAAGRIIGDGEDDRRDLEECGEDAESYQRDVRREDERFDRAQDARDRRDAEISVDIARSRDRQDRYEASRMPRYAPRFVCSSLRRTRYGQLFAIVDTRYDQVVPRTETYSLRECQRGEFRMNRR